MIVTEPGEIQIHQAEFVTSATEPKGYPTNGLPEIAFAGRSNVGKSSLINCLLNRKKLVKTSSTPGKTRLINFFSVNDHIGFVDLPGYGYAKVSMKERQKWQPMVEEYLSTRETLHGVVLLVDARRLPSADDLVLAEYLAGLEMPVAGVLTKVDKLKRNELAKQQKAMRERFGPEARKFLLFSAQTRRGREELWRVILDWVGLSEP